jgi:hypothetical protein
MTWMTTHQRTHKPRIGRFGGLTLLGRSWLQNDVKDAEQLVQCDRQVLSKLRQLSYEQVLTVTRPYLNKEEVKALMPSSDKMMAYFDQLNTQKGENQVLY